MFGYSHSTSLIKKYVAVLLFCGTICPSVLKGQNTLTKEATIDRECHFVLKIQPLYAITHGMLYGEVELFYRRNQSISFQYDFTRKTGNEGLVCISCFLAEGAEKRNRLTLSYRYYPLMKHDIPLYISTYLRYRHWYGDHSDENYSMIELQSFAAGFAIGSHFGLGKRFSLDSFAGYGAYWWHDKAEEFESDIINHLLYNDIRIGLVLGIKLL